MIERFLRWIDAKADGDDTAVLTAIADIVLGVAIIILFVNTF